MRLEVAPTQWADLKELHDVEPINDGDLDCMAEVREVLKKYGKRERFGLALLHKHFEMNDGEVLVENTDEDARELMIRPMKREAVGPSAPTIWMLLDGENRMMLCCNSKANCFDPGTAN